MPLMPPPMQQTPAMVAPVPMGEAEHKEPQDQRFTPTWWRSRLKTATTFRQDHTDPAAARIRNFAGTYFRKNWRGAKEIHGGDWWQMMSDLSPALVSDNPAVSVESFSPSASQAAKALEYALNTWTSRCRLFTILDQVCSDTLWDFGVIHTRLVARTGSQLSAAAGLGISLPALMPEARRLLPTQFGCDPEAELDQGQYQFHWEVHQKETLLAEKDENGQPLYSVEAIEKLAKTPASSEQKKETLRDDMIGQDVGRNEVVVYHIWSRVDGMIYTLGYSPHADEAQGQFLCPPKPHFGDPDGPYVVFGLIWVRGQPLPLSLTALLERNVREKDEHLDKARQDAAAAKQMVAVKGSKQSKAVVNSKNNAVLNVNDLADIKAFKIGGVQDATAQWLAFLDDRTTRMLGMSPARQGDTNTGSTATADVIADTAANRRTKYMQSRWRECVIKVYRKIGHLCWESPYVEFDLPFTDPATGQTVQATFKGGPQKGVPHVPFPELELDIDPFTMEHQTEQSRRERMGAAYTLVLDVADRISSSPVIAECIEWQDLVDDTMEAIGFKRAGRKYINIPKMKQMLAQQAALMAAQAQQQAMMAAGGFTQPKALPPGGRSGASVGDGGRAQVQQLGQATLARGVPQGADAGQQMRSNAASLGKGSRQLAGAGS